jgi:hypothetical protein
MFVCFTNEKDLRHYESIRIKASQYTGIALRVKTITPHAMDNVLYAIEVDSNGGKKDDDKCKNKKDVVALPDTPGLVNLRFEETRISRKAA